MDSEGLAGMRASPGQPCCPGTRSRTAPLARSLGAAGAWRGPSTMEHLEIKGPRGEKTTSALGLGQEGGLVQRPR